jgi:hypothetical protein
MDSVAAHNWLFVDAEVRVVRICAGHDQLSEAIEASLQSDQWASLVGHVVEDDLGKPTPMNQAWPEDVLQPRYARRGVKTRRFPNHNALAGKQPSRFVQVVAFAQADLNLIGVALRF